MRHPDGYVELRDRSKDVIVSGGENIASVEVEQVIAEHPAVLEVFRAPDPVLDPGVGAVAGIEMGELSQRGVSGERGVAPAVELFERVELGAGVRAFPTHDHLRP